MSLSLRLQVYELYRFGVQDLFVSEVEPWGLGV